LEHNELWLALETIAEALRGAGVAVSDDERADIVELARIMGMDNSVVAGLALAAARARQQHERTDSPLPRAAR
jgi:uncharacterized protein with von Willebrand factor type A (vWA) domain